ncbi:hypothetical protein ACVMIX_002106 [Rhizobium leguminosarum]
MTRVFCIGEQITVSFMDRTELQPILRASPAKGLDIVYVEDQLDDGLAAPLPLRGLVQHDIRTAVLSDEFNDPIARQAGRLETEVLLIEACLSSTFPA